MAKTIMTLINIYRPEHGEGWEKFKIHIVYPW